MAVFALRNAGRFERRVPTARARCSRKMWSYLWPGLPEQEVPIESVTNGVHTQTWISREMRELFDRYLGPRWSRDPDVLSLWDAVERDSHRGALAHTRGAAPSAWSRTCAAGCSSGSNPPAPPRWRSQASTTCWTPARSPSDSPRRLRPVQARHVVPARPRALARAMVSDPRRPVQFIIAGKAHPRDEAGKRLIQEIVEVLPRRARARAHPVRGGLRHGRRRAPRARRRRVAEQSAPGRWKRPGPAA